MDDRFIFKFNERYHTSIYTVPTNECKYWRVHFNEHGEAEQSDHYKMVRNSIEKRGIVNPLMGILEDDGDELVRIKIGNTRLMVAKELEIPAVPMILLNYEDEWKKYFDEYTVISVG